MLKESKFFHSNPLPDDSHPIRCTLGAEIEAAILQVLLIDCRGFRSGCQVTKGAHVWSWHKSGDSRVKGHWPKADDFRNSGSQSEPEGLRSMRLKR